MNRSVVIVESPGDARLPRVFGTYKDAERAEAFAARVNEKLEAAEVADRETEDAESSGRDDRGQFEPPSEISYGRRAYVRFLREPRIGDAIDWGKGAA